MSFCAMYYVYDVCVYVCLFVLCMVSELMGSQLHPLSRIFVIHYAMPFFGCVCSCCGCFFSVCLFSVFVRFCWV